MILRNLGINNQIKVAKIPLQLKNQEIIEETPEQPSSGTPSPQPISGKTTLSIRDAIAIYAQGGQLVNNEPDGALIKENTQKIQNLTKEMNNLQVPTNPTKSECDNLRARINTMKDNAKNLFGACEKWLTGNGNSEIEKAYAEFTQTANRKEAEVKLRESASESVLVNNEPDGALIKENTQKIQNLTKEMNNLQVPTNPTKSECDNLRARINTMKDNAKNLIGACEKWLTGNGNSEIEKAYAEFTQTANRKETEVKLRESASESVLVNNEPDGALIKENTQKIQNLTREMNNLQVPTNPTKSECDNLRARINTMKDNAKNLFGACEKWFVNPSSSEIGIAYNKFTQAANRKEMEIKFKYGAQDAYLNTDQDN